MKKANGRVIIELLAGILIIMSLGGCSATYMTMIEAKTVLQQMVGLLIGIIASILFVGGVVLSMLN